MTERGDLFAAHSVTTVLTIVVLAAWVVVAVLANAADTSVPGYLPSPGTVGAVLVFVFAPVIHQSSTAVVSNLLVFLAVGPLVEARLGQRRYLSFAVLTGYTVTALTYAAGMPAVGLSGVTHALTGREAASRVLSLSEVASAQPVWTLVVGVVFAYLTLQLTTGVSVVAHGGGLLLGLAAGVAGSLDPD